MSELDNALGKVKATHLVARKAKDQIALGALGPLLGDVETKLRGKDKFGMPEFYALIKSHIDGLDECLSMSDIDPSQVIPYETQKEVLKSFMPELMDKTQMVDIAAEFISTELSDPSVRDMGKVMGHFRAKYPGEFDGKVLSEIVKDLLAP